MNPNHVSFSQRTGLQPVPPQLKLGEVSTELRRLLDYCLSKEIGRVETHGPSRRYFSGIWEEVAKDLHVIFFKQLASSFENSSFALRGRLEKFVMGESFGQLFDLVEFFACRPGCTSVLKDELADTFVKSRAAYRIVDEQIVAIGTEEQAAAFQAAIASAQAAGASATRQHLIASGSELRNGNWADNVRESIHAVEAMARKIEPSAN
ncbi:AbiJ-NTD4 domain-containing protein, partial [Cypionkella sp.]|uniref:AbiJ-NTD4 domain-containing protein n=1 Tax=Cypionkella sp. TaxID=2811411 RepID=UPI0026072AEF